MLDGHVFEPDDYRYPDWDDTSKCYDWKNYTTQEMRDEWPMFKVKHRRLIATMLKCVAFETEDWD